MDGQAWLADVRALYRSHKDKCERAVAQVPREQWFEGVGGGAVTIAALLKHLGGNHRSRWRDFLTTDGEKADRDRDSEFAVAQDNADSIRAVWDAGWQIALDSLEQLTEADLEREVTIRGQPHSVAEAIERNLNHVVYHTGQVVLLARTLAGESWQTLSIAPGESEQFNAKMRERFGDWNGENST